MVYLIEKGLPNKDAFDIMECVRKGKSPAVFPEKKYEELMKKYNVKRCYYGHLHGNSIYDAVEGKIQGIELKLVSADGLDFKLIKI